MSILEKIFNVEAALKTKHRKGSIAYHQQKAMEYINAMDKEAKEKTGWKGDNDFSKGYKERTVAYMDHMDKHPNKKLANKHLKALLKLTSKTTASSETTPIPADQELWNRCKARAKAKFDVYPSWVANQWVVKKYKKLGGTFK